LLRDDLESIVETDPDLVSSMLEDLTTIADSAKLIVSVQEHLIGPAREEKPRPVMADDVVKDTAVALGIPAEMVTYTIAPDLPLIVADPTQLSRAFGYVLKNAVEAMKGADEQRITVEFAPARALAGAPADEENIVAVRVADTGPGIPEEDMEKIWAAFYTTKGVKHAGLGLSACFQILKQADGQISAANAPDGGAVFELLIPIFDGTLAPAKLPSDKSILLIDDDDAWSRFVQTTMTDAGNRVTRSVDGQVDLDAFDLILVDDAPEIADIRAVLKQIRAAGAGPKTLVVASSLRVERTMELMPFGVQDVVLKPYTVDALVELVG
jgi:CheY-like chemotaxis protein